MRNLPRSLRSARPWLCGASLLLSLLAAGCSDESENGTGDTTGTTSSETSSTSDTMTDSTSSMSDTTSSTSEPPDEGVPEECDPLVPSACVLPFPSSKHLADDAKTPTGKHVLFPTGALPMAKDGHIPGDGFTQLDGFSPGLAPFTHMPGATATGLPDLAHIEDSIKAESPTVILDTSTGELVPHFAELDVSVKDAAKRVLYVRPVVRLKDATRYIVAIRHVVDDKGAELKPSLAFQALRDGTPYKHASIDARRALYDDIFKKLTDAGVDKASLQIAWDYTTSSRDNHTKVALSMRDQALAEVGASGPVYAVDSSMDNPYTDIARRIDGHMTVPLYLDKPGTGARLNVDADGVPKKNGTADYGFTVLVPAKCTTGTPCPILQYGHGLLGARDEVTSNAVRSFITTHGYVAFATDWIGMAEDDQNTVAIIVGEGDISKFATTPERSMQGFTNAILAMRLMGGAFAADMSVKFNGMSAIDPSQKYYYGNSQGGILGAALMALHVDVKRGILGVPGQPYNLLLHRSKDFTPFFGLLQIRFPNAVDQNIALALVQMLWDRGEPTGYTAYMSGPDRLPGTPDHEVLLHVAIGDHQVSSFGAHVMARTVGAKLATPAVRPVFGLTESQMPFAGSGIVEYDFGLAPEPLTNIPPSDGNDPHGALRKLPQAQAQMDAFLRTGMVTDTCPAPCKFPPP